MTTLQGDRVKQKVAFEIAFEMEFKKSTYHENFQLWKKAAAIPGEQARWIRFGRSERGEWARFVRAMRSD